MLPHLLLAYDFPPIGGGLARWMSELARYYPPGGMMVSTGQMRGSEAVDSSLPNPVDRIGLPSRRLRTIQGLLFWSRRVARLCRSSGAGFVWCGNFKPAAYPAAWARERTGTPFGVMVYGTDLLLLQHQIHQSRVKRRIARSLLQPASVVLAISRYTRELFLTVSTQIGLAVPPDRVRVVPLGTDPDHFHPGVDTAAVRERYGLEEGPWLLTVARLTLHKGIDTSIRALALLHEEFPGLRYAVVGSGSRREMLRRVAADLGVADRVRFLTEVPDSDLPGLYNLATIYLGVSRQVDSAVEGFGLALVEASACGRPVIGGRSGGIPDAVREGETGLLVDPSEPAAVAEGIRSLLRSPDLAARLGAGGRRAVETYYNWPRVIADVQAIGEEFSRPA